MQGHLDSVPDGIREVLEDVADEVYGVIASEPVPPGGPEGELPQAPYRLEADVVADPERLRLWLREVDVLWRLDVVDALGECLDEVEDG